MARTKVAKAKPAPSTSDKSIADTLELNIAVKKLQEDKIKYIEDLKNKAKETFENYNSFIQTLQLSIPPRLLKKTLAEISRGDVSETTMATTVSNVSSIPSMKSLRRSTSFTNDEGYSTADSNSGSTGRRSRSKTRTATKQKATRSLSRTSMKKAAAYKTPAHTNKGNQEIGTITPKCKPNMAQVLLRRPKQGEVALSFQGSPLFTGAIVSESLANVNIPLPDGNLLTLQPQRGLRMSQIPEVDQDTQRQLQVLRDHLNKVCALAQIKK